jgi:aminopeptidase N
VLTLAALLPTADAAIRFRRRRGSLPKDVRPAHYRLELALDPAMPRFTGIVEIDVEVVRPVDAIVLNAHGLTTTAAPRLLEPAGGERGLTVAADEGLQQWRLATSPVTTFPAGSYRLRIEYAGEVQRVGQGMFVVEYTADAAPARMLATQFQPGHARKVFPGFDEPAFRARFDLTVRAPDRHDVVSNMPVSSAHAADGLRATSFATTPPMPTYLLGIAVGEFDVLADRQDGVELRILTARGRREQARYAMEATKQLLPYFADYFGQPYMLPKLDQLAIPGVRGGAMEDWGVISYNEALLLYDPGRSAPRTKATVFNVVAHEIAHQWFGNLVTAAWWDDLWLNEAFATWMAGKATERFNPDWDLKARLRSSKEDAFRRDAGGATRPMVVPVRTEADAFAVFDEITYQKGGSVLSMFEQALGPDVFRDGLRRYILAHAYSNATADDLWYHLSQAAGRDVAREIGGWVARPGFPILDVATRCIDGRTEVRISQQRFTSQSLRELVAMWHVPVVLRGSATTRKLTLGREPGSARFDGCVPVIANAGDTGYYRVRYDAGAGARLRRAFATLPALDRAAITADTLALAKRGGVPIADYVALTALPAPRTSGEWLLLVEGLDDLDEALAGTPAQAALRRWARARIAPQFDRLGWADAPGDSLTTLRLRGALVDALGRFDHAPTIERARRAYADGTAAPSTVAGVLNTVGRHADAATYASLLAARRTASGQEERWRLEHAIALVRDPKLAKRTLDLTLTDEWQPGVATRMATQVGAVGGHAELAFAFVQQHFAALAAKSGDGGKLWLLPRSAARFNETAWADRLLAAQDARLGEAGRDPARRVAEAIREKSAIRSAEGGRLAMQLRSPVPSGIATPAEQRPAGARRT